MAAPVVSTVQDKGRGSTGSAVSMMGASAKKEGEVPVLHGEQGETELPKMGEIGAAQEGHGVR